MLSARRRRKVAILGGGCAGVAAAFRLTATPALRAAVDVTLHQQGFRLGGKGATGRDPSRGHRILEHGLHVWLGSYDRAFAMMRDCLDEWSPPAGTSRPRMEDTFSGHHRVTLCEGGPESAELWHLTLPPRPGLPWQPPGRRDWLEYLASLRRWLSEEAWAEVLRSSGAPGRRQARILAALAATILRGLLVDVLPFGWEEGCRRLDGLDFRQWLIGHGAGAPEVNDAPPVRAIYDLGFAYPDGVSGRGRGQVAAGAALKALLRVLFGYRGAPFWRMRAGMGDSVFAPMLDVLRARGVRVAFFHQVTNLSLDPAHRLVSRIDLRRQAETRGEYDPLVPVGDRRCWPAEPRWDHLVDGERLRASGADFESSACLTSAGERTLARGQDFDDVVLAIPAPALPPIAGALAAAHPPFQQMLETTRSVRTWAMQLWLRPTLAQLGWPEAGTIMTSFSAPFGSWADMTEVAAAERWSEGDRPGAVAYFCDVAPDRPAGDLADLRAAARSFCTGELPRLWPGLIGRDDRALYLGGFDDQYFRINQDPSERYVLSLPGSTRFRLAADQSGFDNLFLAGDWIRTSINGGSVEAAVEAGFAAADAILRRCL